MKTAKIVFTLFLINVFFALPHVVKAQDVLTVTVEEGSGVNALWHFSFKHSSTSKVSVSQFLLSIDPTQFPDVQFGVDDMEAHADSQSWSAGTSSNQDTAIWCADLTGFIAPGGQDSFFAFQLVPNPNIQNANIFGYPITINWVANFASENGQMDPCANTQFVSNGSFVVEDFPWTGNFLDTVTATSSTPGCDPLFNFTVSSKNSTQLAIDGLVFFTDEFAGTMRPSDVQLPSPWVLDSVTQAAVYCHAPNGNGINYGQSLSGFIIGLLADPSATSFSFPWEALSEGTIIDEDTVWNVPATVQPCSTNGSSDTVSISNNSNCSFNANLENSHSGSGGDTVSLLTTFIISTPTPGDTLIDPVLPNFTEYPWAKGWADSGKGTNKITFFIPNKPLLYGQPGGITAPWGFSVDKEAEDSPDVIINWQALEGGRVISSGSDTIHCSGRIYADKAVITVLDGCEYMLVLTNTHTPQSGLEGAAIQIPPANGTIPFTKGTYSGPTGWTPSDGSGGSIRFQTNSSSDYLGIGKSDTFYFTISPTTQNASLPLTLFTYKSGTGDQQTDSVMNVPGCVPTPVLVCDTVTETIDSVNCGAIFTVNNRRTNAIDRVVVLPAPASGRFINPGIPPATNPWTDTIAQNGDSVVFVGSSIEPNGAPVSFAVSFNSGKAHQRFPVIIRTYSSGVECTTIDTMDCEGTASVGMTSAPTQDLALTVAPNPLNSRSDIGFTLGSFSNVDLVLVDILGRTQATLFSGTLSSGDHSLPLDASTLTPGTYYIRLEAEGQRVTKKIVVEH